MRRTIFKASLDWRHYAKYDLGFLYFIILTICLKLTYLEILRVEKSRGFTQSSFFSNGLTFYKSKNDMVETPRKFNTAKLSIRKLGSSSVLMIMHSYQLSLSLVIIVHYY